MSDWNARADNTIYGVVIRLRRKMEEMEGKK